MAKAKVKCEVLEGTVMTKSGEHGPGAEVTLERDDAEVLQQRGVVAIVKRRARAGARTDENAGDGDAGDGEDLPDETGGPGDDASDGVTGT